MFDMILHFDQVEEVDYDQAGGKGYTLARLRRAGFPVPSGFIVTTDAYRAFATSNGLVPHVADTLADEDPAAASARIWADFEEAEMPPALADAIRDAYLALGEGEVAVRSSALAEDDEAASFAGQYETILGIVGCDALIAAVRRCWASLWSERALAYHRRLGSAGDPPTMAVVVQRMVPATQAGVAFTLDPVSGRRDVVVIEAVAGRGEALVDGRAIPYRYVIRRRNGRPKSEEGVLDAIRLAAVVRLAQEVEGWAGRPQDVEWALDEAGRVYLLQARPITVSGATAPKVVIRWTRDNVGEVLPDPVTPLSWSVFDRLGNRSFAGVLRRLGAADYPAAGLFGRFYGRVYLNQTLFQAVMNHFYPSRAGWHSFPRLVLMASRALLFLHYLPGESEAVIEVILERRRSEEGLDLSALALAGVLARLADFSCGACISAEGEPLTFDANASSDPNHDPLIYTWAFGDGSGGSGQTLTHPYPDNGTHTVILTVEDDDAMTATQQHVVTITNVSPAPTITAPGTAASGEAVTFIANANDPGDDTFEYRWDWGGGAGVMITTMAVISHVFTSADVYTITLRVVDDDGGTGETRHFVNVSPGVPDPYCTYLPIILR